ncbi:MAG: glycosyltransferase family 4 protein [Gammaproteobacteria bacterium]
MKRVLLISPLDPARIPNSRDQNTLPFLVRHGTTVVLLYLVQNVSRRLRDLVRDSLFCSVRAATDGPATRIRIDPPLNPCTGLEADVLQARAAGATTFDAKGTLIRLLSPLGVLRDVLLIPVFYFVARRDRDGFDVCLAYGPWAACVGWLLKKSGRVRLLVYEDQDFEPGIVRNPLRKRWAGWLENTLIAKADIVICVGERLAARRRRDTGQTIHVIPNGLDAKLFRTAAATAQRPPTLIYMGNVVPWSGLDLLIDVLPRLVSKFPELKLLIVGTGMPSYLDCLGQQVAATHLDAHVDFVGQVAHDDLPHWLSKASIGMAHFRPDAYRTYAFPLKVVEYMACGLPVIGTQGTETEDLLQRYACGLAIPFTAEALSAAIETLLSDRSLYISYRDNALRASADFEWERLLEQESQLIAAALHAKSP